MIVATKTGVVKARRSLSPAAAAALRAAETVAVWREGDEMRQMLVDHLTGKLHGKRPARLKATTLATRRARGNNSAAPLADTREMIEAIALKRVPKGAFIGIPNSSVNRKGFSLAKLAEIQEKGATIAQRITPGEALDIPIHLAKNTPGSGAAPRSALASRDKA